MYAVVKTSCSTKIKVIMGKVLSFLNFLQLYFKTKFEEKVYLNLYGIITLSVAEEIMYIGQF